MRGLQYFFLLGLLLLAPIALAAGGGGGGGGGGGASSSSGGGGGGSGPYFIALQCNDKGVLSFQQAPPIKPVKVERVEGSYNLTVAGEWDGTSFKSEEAEMMEAGEYIIRDSRNGDKTVECPGLKFSCRLLNLSLTSCILDNNNLTADFSLQGPGTVIEDLEYKFTVLGSPRTLNYNQESRSAEVSGLKVNKVGIFNYTLTLENSPAVHMLQVSHPECVGKYYVYSKMRCTEPEESSVTVSDGSALKCGGYLDIRDRVRCRLDLREEQADEYENFFPEECRSWEDQQKCIQLYRAVQNCWELPNSIARISCLQGKVGITNVREQKSGCGEDQACLQALREDVYTLIKLRLYNLEEEAEEWMEEGKLTSEEVADFVVHMEQSKLAFNQAQTKQERKQVIMQARQYWLELVRRVRQR